MTGDGGDATAAFVAALRTASAALAEVPGKLEGARVHDAAFGKLFEASEVRNAYHQRLPETETDIAEAREVIEHFIAGLEGGHPIGPRVAPAGAGDAGGAGGAAPLIPAQPTEHEVTGHEAPGHEAPGHEVTGLTAARHADPDPGSAEPALEATP